MKYIHIIIYSIVALLLLLGLYKLHFEQYQAHLILSPDVSVIMLCRAPLLTGATVCLPEGHTYKGIYEEWVD